MRTGNHSAPPGAARAALVIGDLAVLAVSLWLAYLIRFDFAIPEDAARSWPLVFLWVAGLQALWLWRARQFDLLGYFNLGDSSGVFWALLAPNALVFLLSHQFGSAYAPPRSVVIADLGFAVIGLTGIRLAARRGERLGRRRQGTKPPTRRRRAGIIGAGLVGTALAREFEERPDLGLQAVAFFDDDRTKWGKRIHDVPIVGAPEALAGGGANLELEEIVVAMPSARPKRVAEIGEILRQLRIKFSTVPSIYELTTGAARVGQLRPVDLKDLLGREQVQLGSDAIRGSLQNKVVMVTGAGGSIGGELCRQIAGYGPRRLLLFEQSEVQLFQIEQELANGDSKVPIVPLIADLLDRPRLEQILERFHPEIIFHAAAHKHVPMMERQPGEAIKNNAFGTLQLGELAQRHAVASLVLISSDKAINPTNVMGATKRLAEMCVQGLHAAQPEGTRFMAVRFGNVLGSSGSVVPTFSQQIASGGPVKVTHPEVTRYFMTISEAVGLVLQSATLGSGGEIFLLDMGQPVRIVDLARHLIELTGRVPGRDVRIEFTGLRPGEKLFEELCYQGENVTTTRHPKINRLVSGAIPISELRLVIEELFLEADLLEADQLKRLLQRAVPEYRPQFQADAPAAAPRRPFAPVLRRPPLAAPLAAT